ncbi:MAG: hypothetical protein QUS66_08630 [Bacteroidota bacterium]|nr:hypothetical protein [Bacteroidota bacterium]
MRGFKYIFCIILAVHVVSLTGQSKSDLRELFVSAEGDLLFEDYAEALPKYMSLLQIYPENYNLYFRIGQCYLNTPGEKDKAIPWLETAAGHMNPDYRGGRLRESGAPYDALYFLANAYRIANEFDRALETYELFLKDVDTEKYDTALVRFQMQTCHNAREMMKKPVFLVDRNLGEGVNERFSEFNPVVSADEKTLLFTRELQFYDAIFWSRKDGEVWTEPVNLTPQLGVDQDYYTSSLSPDGKTLLMYRIDTYDGNIYMSRLAGDTWSTVEKLNGNINTRFWESHAAMSSDGKKIYFTSNRKESLGGLDIFVSARDSSGNWGPAVNLGPEINTLYNEETPFLANNDRTLFFSSRGHFNMGGYDIFRSDLDENGKWTTPVNIGYPLNTTDDDLFFTPVGSGKRGYHARFAGDGFGKMDLFACDIYTGELPAFTNDKEMEADEFTDTVSMKTFPPEKADLSAYLRLVSDTLLMVSSADPVTVELVAEENSRLEIMLFEGDSPARTEQFSITDTAFAYTFRPVRGDNLLSLKLTDGFGNDTSVSVTVRRTDAPARVEKPLYNEIPARPATEKAEIASTDAEAAASEAKSADAATGAGAAAAVNAATAAAPAPATDKTSASLTGSEGAAPSVTGTADRGNGCSRWWLLAVAAFIIFFLLWRRRKKKKDEEQ